MLSIETDWYAAIEIPVQIIKSSTRRLTMMMKNCRIIPHILRRVYGPIFMNNLMLIMWDNFFPLNLNFQLFWLGSLDDSADGVSMNYN